MMLTQHVCNYVSSKENVCKISCVTMVCVAPERPGMTRQLRAMPGHQHQRAGGGASSWETGGKFSCAYDRFNGIRACRGVHDRSAGGESV